MIKKIILSFVSFLVTISLMTAQVNCDQSGWSCGDGLGRLQDISPELANGSNNCNCVPIPENPGSSTPPDGLVDCSQVGWSCGEGQDRLQVVTPELANGSNNCNCVADDQSSSGTDPIVDNACPTSGVWPPGCTPPSNAPQGDPCPSSGVWPAGCIPQTDPTEDTENLPPSTDPTPNDPCAGNVVSSSHNKKSTGNGPCWGDYPGENCGQYGELVYNTACECVSPSELNNTNVSAANIIIDQSVNNSTVQSINSIRLINKSENGSSFTASSKKAANNNFQLTNSTLLIDNDCDDPIQNTFSFLKEYPACSFRIGVATPQDCIFNFTTQNACGNQAPNKPFAENKADFYNTFADNFNIATAENVMKMSSILFEGQHNNYDGLQQSFGALASDIPLRGHTLIWHQNPSHMNGQVLQGNREELESYVHQFIADINRSNPINIGHTVISPITQSQANQRGNPEDFAGRFESWDVVNEALKGIPRPGITSPFRDNPNGSGGSSVLWANMGFQNLQTSFISPGTTMTIPSYIDATFRAAHSALVNAGRRNNEALIYNDWGAEFGGPLAGVFDQIPNVGSKADAQLLMLDALLTNGTPIDGVGFQCHFSVDPNNPDTNILGESDRFEKNIDRIIDLFNHHGKTVKIYFTEVDIRIPESPSANDIDRQQSGFRRVMELAHKYRGHMEAVVFWGITDRYSWIRTDPQFVGFDHALLFNDNYGKKEGYNMMLDVLNANGAPSCSNNFEAQKETSTLIDLKPISDDINKKEVETNLFPNPFSGNLKIEHGYKEGNLMIYNIDGKLVHSQLLSPEVQEIDLSRLVPGTFSLHILTKEKQETHKLVKI